MKTNSDTHRLLLLLLFCVCAICRAPQVKTFNGGNNRTDVIKGYEGGMNGASRAGQKNRARWIERIYRIRIQRTGGLQVQRVWIAYYYERKDGWKNYKQKPWRRQGRAGKSQKEAERKMERPAEEKISGNYEQTWN